MRGSFILTEQLHQMERYKWLKSEEAGYDLGETALYDWVDRYASSFREWAESLPSECIGCGACIGETGMECPNPFNQRRKGLMKEMGIDVISCS